MKYGRILAAEIAGGGLDIDGLADLDDEAAIAALTRVKGIGRWTAEIYLPFALGRPDLLPAADLALRVAAHPMNDPGGRPDVRGLCALGAAWTPPPPPAAPALCP